MMGREQKIVSVSCEKDIGNLESPVKGNTTAGVSRSNISFKRNLLDIQYSGEKLANAYKSLSADQKNAFKNEVIQSM